MGSDRINEKWVTDYYKKCEEGSDSFYLADKFLVSVGELLSSCVRINENGATMGQWISSIRNVADAMTRYHVSLVQENDSKYLNDAVVMFKDVSKFNIRKMYSAVGVSHGCSDIAVSFHTTRQIFFIASDMIFAPMSCGGVTLCSTDLAQKWFTKSIPVRPKFDLSDPDDIFHYIHKIWVLLVIAARLQYRNQSPLRILNIITGK